MQHRKMKTFTALSAGQKEKIKENSFVPMVKFYPFKEALNRRLLL